MKRIVGIVLFFAVFLLSAVEKLDWSKAKTVQKGVVHLRIEEPNPA